MEFEQHTALGPTFAAKLLGYAYPTYAQWRCGSRSMQIYTERHVRALMLLPAEVLEQQIKEQVYAAKASKA